jgi:CheY-like chemotaxis protein
MRIWPAAGVVRREFSPRKFPFDMQMQMLLSLLRWREQANPPMVANLIESYPASAPRDVMSKQVLIVDDEPNVRLAYRLTLEAEGMSVHQADGAAAALEKLSTTPIDLAILDLRMPEMDGLELLAEMRKRGHSTPTVIITAYGEIPHAVRAMKLGAIDFLEKPLTPEALRRHRRGGFRAPHADRPPASPCGGRLWHALFRGEAPDQSPDVRDCLDAPFQGART